jgi:choline dehydrogenase-like flavoprotein
VESPAGIAVAGVESVQNERVDVVVVGAGAAGLAAAAELRKDGRSVVVLEARDHIGGRVHTTELQEWGCHVDVGASWIHGTMGNPVTLLRDEAKIQTAVTDVTSIAMFDLFGQRLDAARQERIHELAEAAIAKIDRPTPARSALDSLGPFVDQAVDEAGVHGLELGRPRPAARTHAVRGRGHALDMLPDRARRGPVRLAGGAPRAEPALDLADERVPLVGDGPAPEGRVVQRCDAEAVRERPQLGGKAVGGDAAQPGHAVGALHVRGRVPAAGPAALDDDDAARPPEQVHPAAERAGRLG